jgi:hypothetical protein
MSGYLVLKCETCGIVFAPIGATNPGELLNVDEEQALRQIGESGTRMLLDFRHEHQGHELGEIEMRVQ